ncbi:MAG: hypothetical protein RBS68_14005 [Anaerolineales bacterium]|jgi:hypothetical protein|nr:hypothetical protein [Anaerolineales bacterium]
MKQDRFLLGILLGIAALVVIALVTFLARPDGLQYGPDNTPEGVVRNYTVAIHLQDYEKAYTYLAEGPHKPSLDQFREPFLLKYINSASAGLEVLESKISGNKASVEVSVLYSSNDVFSGGYRNSEYAALVSEAGQWKISQMAYPFWYYDWYQEPYKEPKP